MATNLHSFELYSDYPLPEWSSKPEVPYFLEIIKNGVILEEISLKGREFFLIGRLQDLSDIVVQHPSISRKHAVLQYKNTGELFVYDLDSTHGTFLNNKRLSPRTFAKLHAGDLLKFGCSLRFYVVRNPNLENSQRESIEISSDIGLIKSESVTFPSKQPEVPSENSLKRQYIKLLRDFEAKELGVPRVSREKTEKSEENGVFWGIDDENAVYSYQEEHELRLEPRVLRDLPGINEKQLEKIEQFENKLLKYQAILAEYEEICRKERKDFGLDENSKGKKELLEKKTQELASQLETLEETLKLMIFKEKTLKRKIEKVQEEDTFENDEYYDRTLVSAKKLKTEEKSLGNPGESKEKKEKTHDFASLKENYEDLLKKQDALNLKILDFEEKKPQNPEAQEIDDELEKFMQKNQESLDLQQKSRLFEELQQVNKELEEVKRLLRIVRPSYEFSVKKISIPLKPPEISLQKPADFPKPREKLSQTLEKLHAISQQFYQKSQNPENFADFSAFHEDDQEKDINKDQEKHETQEKPEEISTKSKVYGVTSKPKPRNFKEKDVEKKKVNENSEWLPPKNQKGDGVTDLNAKYGY